MRSLKILAFLPAFIGCFSADGVAQTDPEARALIQQLRSATSDRATRGIRLPVGGGAESPSVVASQQPAPPLRHAPAEPVRSPPPRASAPVEGGQARSTTAPSGVPAVSIMVNFASGSAELSASAAQSLGPLGRALMSEELLTSRFRIEGHTDTVGDRLANRSLSERRANAVGAYLTQHYGVAPSRLEINGRGEDELLVQTTDNVPEARNRRVQVLNLGR